MPRTTTDLLERRGMLLLLVLLVVSGISLTALAFSESMLAGYEESLLMGRSAQARAAADSGVAAVRVFLANPKSIQKDAGGTWSNPTYFQAVNVVPDSDPQELCHFSVVAPSLDEEGRYNSIRFGLQNESARINLNALVVIDKELGTTSSAAAALTGAGNLGDLSGLGIPSDLTTGSGNTSGDGSSGASSLGRQLLMGLGGMTEEIADCILDYIDEDEEVRELGAESDYYAGLQSPFKPANAPLHSVDELLLVKGVTPAMLYGSDQNRNGIIDGFEQSQYNAGGLAGNSTSSSNTGSSENSETSVPQLGWAAYLTTVSREKNVGFDGTPRVNVNGVDLETLKTDLETALGNENWSSYILAYRLHGGTSGDQAGIAAMLSNAVGGQLPSGGNMNSGFGPGGPGGGGNAQNARPNQTGDRPSGGQGSGQGGRQGGGRTSLFVPQASPRFIRLVVLQPPQGNARQPDQGGGQGGNRPGGAGGGRPGSGGPGGASAVGGVGGNAAAKPVPWTSSALKLSSGDPPKANLRQVLDLIGSTVTIQEGNQSITYTSPFDSSPIAMALYLPTLMDKLTTVDSPTIAGRININEAPREILAGLPGMTEEILEQVMGARAEESESENRKFETWPMVEGFLTLQQMRLIQPLITGSGDVYRAQVVGYYEQGAAFSRIEAWIDSSDTHPKVISYRRMDHLGRGFANSTLGQRSVNNPLRSK